MAFGVYTWLHVKQPGIVYQIEAETNIVDLHTAMPDLAILFRGADIRAQNLNLRVLSIKISNEGDLDLLQPQYEQGDPWGFKISSAQIIDARLTGTNSEYLKTHLAPKLGNVNQVLLAKCIFEKQKWVDLDVFILHSRSASPEVIPIGKIAGVETIPVLKEYLTRDGETFWHKISSGTFGIQMARLVFYVLVFFGLITSLVALSVGVSSVSDAWKRKRRERRASRLIAPADDSNDVWRILVEIYIAEGIGAIKRLKRFLKDPEQLRERIRLRLQAVEAQRLEAFDRDDLHLQMEFEYEYERLVSPEIRRLISSKLIQPDDHWATICVDPRLPSTVDELLPELIEVS